MATRKSRSWVNFEYFEEKLTGRWAISLWQWLLCVPLAIFASFDRITKLTDLSSRDSLIIAFLDSLFSGIAYLITSELILRNRRTVRQSLEKIFMAYVFISVFTSIFEMIASAVLFGQQPLIGTQLLTPIFPNFIGLVITATLIAEFSDSNIRLKGIYGLGRDLIQNDAAINEEFEREKNILVSGVNQYLIPQLVKIRKALDSAKLSGSGKDKISTIEVIEEFANQSVRVFAHELYSKEVGLLEKPKVLEEKRAKIASEIYSPIISIKLVVVFGLLIGGSQQLSLNGPKGLLYDVIAIFTITVLGLISSQVMNLISKTYVEIRYFFFFIHLVIIGVTSEIFFGYLQNQVFNFEFKYDTGPVIFRNVLNVLISSAIVTLIQGREKLTKEAEMLNSKIQVQMSVRKRLLLDLRSRVASILHGQIQGRLAGIALALRLEESIPIDRNKEDEISKLLELVENELRTILQSVLEDDETSISQVLDTVSSEWKSIVEIDMDLEIDEEFVPSSNTLRYLKLVASEAIANAVRHGRARNIRITVKKYRRSKDRLHLIIVNDGLPISEDRAPGQGFKNLDMSTADWTIKNLDLGKVSMEAII